MIVHASSTGVAPNGSGNGNTLKASGSSVPSNGRINHFHRPPRPRQRSVSRSSSSPSPPPAPTQTLRSSDPSSSSGNHGSTKDRRRSSSSRPGPATASSSTKPPSGKSHLRVSVDRDSDGHKLNATGPSTPPVDRSHGRSDPSMSSFDGIGEAAHVWTNGSTPPSPSSPVSAADGFSTQHSYGASASSRGLGSESERELDRFVSASGELTETEASEVGERGGAQAYLSSRAMNGQIGAGSTSLTNDGDPRMLRNGM